MQKPNIPSQQINYYVQYQPNNLLPNHMNQPHSSNVQVYHKIQPQINYNKLNPDIDSNKSRGSFYQYQNQQISFRKELPKNTSIYHTNSQNFNKYGSIDYSNPESNQINTSRASYTITTFDNNAQRNKSLLQMKRKESNNISREIREQYYKSPQGQELLSKLPQIDFQQLTKISTTRPYYASPSSDLKVKQQKKTVPPFNFQTKNYSYKQSNQQSNQTKSTEQNQENKKIKQGIKFSSPTKTTFPLSKTLKQLEANRWVNPYSEKGFQQTIRKQYTPQTSNSTSSTFQTPVKPSSASYKPSYLNGFNNKNQNQNFGASLQQFHKRQIAKHIELYKKLEQNLEQQKNINNQKDIRIKNLQNDIILQKQQMNMKQEERKKKLAQRQRKLEEMNKKEQDMDKKQVQMNKKLGDLCKKLQQQHKKQEELCKKYEQTNKKYQQTNKKYQQMNKKCQQANKKYQQMNKKYQQRNKKWQQKQKELVNKKQETANLLKQCEKQIQKLSNEIKQKNLEETKIKHVYEIKIKEVEDRYEAKIKEVEDRYEAKIKQIQNKNEIKIEEIKKQKQKQKDKQKNKYKTILEEQQKKMADRIVRNLQLQKNNQILENKIRALEEQLLNKNKDILALNHTIEHNNNNNNKITLKTPNYAQNHESRTKGMSIEQIIDKNRLLEEKNCTYLSNIDKISQKYKEAKAQIQKLIRKIEQLNTILCEKDNLMRNMNRDMRNKDKFMSEGKKKNQQLQKIVKQSNEQLIKLSCRRLNQKYRLV